MTRWALGWLLLLLAVARADVGKASAYSASRGEEALLVWQNGRVIFERGAPEAAPRRIFSVTKSLVSIGVFRDMLRGGLTLDQPVSRGPAQGIRLCDLLNQTSGLPPRSDEFYSTGLRDKSLVLRTLGSGRKAGGGFVYGASHWEVLAEEIELCRGPSVQAWLCKFVPGIDRGAAARWRRDGAGRFFFSTGARMNSRELLPAGREVLRGMGNGAGRWPAQVRQLLASGTEQNAMYALGFWLNRAAGQPDAGEIEVENSLAQPKSPAFWRRGCLSRAAPPDLLAMIGTDGQRVYAVPSRQLVIVRLGRGAGFSDREFLGKFFGS